MKVSICYNKKQSIEQHRKNFVLKEKANAYTNRYFRSKVITAPA